MPVGSVNLTFLIAVFTLRSPANSTCTVPTVDMPPMKSSESANGMPMKKLELSPPFQHNLSVATPA